MPDIILWTVVFAISLGVLIKASDYFTAGASSLGLILRAPGFVIGVTVVSVGTSLPELSSSLIAVLEGSPEIVAGNVIGSNVANIFLIAGVAAIIGRKVRIGHHALMLDLYFLLASALLLALCAWDGVFDRLEAALCLAGFLLYMLYNIRDGRGEIDLVKALSGDGDGDVGETPRWSMAASLTVILLSGVFVFIGAKYTVEAIIRLSVILGVGSEVIAASAVALGTSLPELAVSVAAARRGNFGIAMGNVIGSNIFNSFVVMSVPALTGALVVPAGMVMFGLPVMLAATLLFIHLIQDREVTSWEGWMLLIFYAFFLIRLLGFG